MPATYHISHLRTLESEAVHAMRDLAADIGGSLYNGRIRKGAHAPVFPVSNWTELDVWQYIAEEDLEVPSICFVDERVAVTRMQECS